MVSETSGGDLPIITCTINFAENLLLPTINLNVELLPVTVGELSTKLEIIQDRKCSACHILFVCACVSVCVSVSEVNNDQLSKMLNN